MWFSRWACLGCVFPASPCPVNFHSRRGGTCVAGGWFISCWTSRITSIAIDLTRSSLTRRYIMHSYFSLTDSVYSMTSCIWMRLSAWLLLTCSYWWRSSLVTCSCYSSYCSCISCCTCLFFYYSIMPWSIFTSCYFWLTYSSLNRSIIPVLRCRLLSSSSFSRFSYVTLARCSPLINRNSCS